MRHAGRTLPAVRPIKHIMAASVAIVVAGRSPPPATAGGGGIALPHSKTLAL